jgi:hypothetical protein
MEFLAQLWLPILLTAVGLFFASFIAWTVLPHHKADFTRLPDEPKFEALLRTLAIPPGNYGFPHCGSSAQMKDPEFQKRWAAGPTGVISVWPPMSMGRNMALTFFVQLIAAILTGSLMWSVLAAGAEFGRVFQAASGIGALTWCFASLPTQIWFGQTGATMARHILDGVGYALLTGLIFAAFWPAAA